jgi:hypothetical protein
MSGETYSRYGETRLRELVRHGLASETRAGISGSRTKALSRILGRRALCSLWQVRGTLCRVGSSMAMAGAIFITASTTTRIGVPATLRIMPGSVGSSGSRRYLVA